MKTPQKPIPKLKELLNINNEVWFKFENKHHFGSHKGRSLPVMIDEYLKQGMNSFVISSSGNAALAALKFVISHNKNKPGQPIHLTIFVGPSIADYKLQKLKSELTPDIDLIQVKNPKQESLKFSKEKNALLLRGSTDPLALLGYHNLAEELYKIPDLSAVFLATSSGTSAEGLVIGFKNIGKIPEIHIVQTESCHPIANYFFEQNNLPSIATADQKSLADAIVDRVGLRKISVVKEITDSKGAAWVVSEKEIREALNIAGDLAGDQITGNGALSLAGLKKAVLNGRKWNGSVVCVIGGD